MVRTFLLAVPLLLSSTTVFAGQSFGNAAVALAALIGAEDPSLSAGEKSVLTHFLAGQTNVALPADAHRILVKADKIRCRMGDVDLGLHDCTLTFGAKTATRTGAAGQMLLATMIQNGVESDGAAGTIFYTIAPITCTIDADEIEAHDGGGAMCTFASGE